MQRLVNISSFGWRARPVEAAQHDQHQPRKLSRSVNSLEAHVGQKLRSTPLPEPAVEWCALGWLVWSDSPRKQLGGDLVSPLRSAGGFSKHSWGKGYASEAAQRALAFAVNELG